jgi:ubiquinone/menaquinone biosynthesis C-methylase UbiE
MSCWRWKAPVYSLARRLPFFRHLLAAEQNNLVKLLQQFSPLAGVHLDLGSGTGDNLSILPGAANRIAVDAEISMLRRNPASRRVVARAEALPFAAASFAFVSAIGLLEYINDLEIFFREARRVLQPEGCFLFTSSPPNWANRWRVVWGEKLYFYPEQQLLDFLQENGWHILGQARSWLQEQWLVAPAEVTYR